MSDSAILVCDNNLDLMGVFMACSVDFSSASGYSVPEKKLE